MLKWYYLDEFKSKDEYAKFIEYMLKNSDFFSVIYFRYNEQEPLKRSVKQIRDELRKYKIYSKNTKEWPGKRWQGSKTSLNILRRRCKFHNPHRL